MSILSSYVKNDFQAVEGDAWKETWPVDMWDEDLQQWVPLPLSAVQSITCTARNEGDNAIVNSRNAQNILNLNNGTFETGFFSFFFQPADTAIVGDAELVDQETHQFAFTILLNNGTKTTIAATVYCFAAPAVEMTAPGNVGRVIQILRNMVNESDPVTVTDELLTTYIQRGANACSERARYYTRDFTPAQQLIGPLVAGQPDYALPGNVNEVLLAYLGTNPLQQKDFLYLQQRQLPVLEVQSGTPTSYILWSRRIYFDPPPNAAAVAATPYPWLRCWTAPPPFRLYGLDQIPLEFEDVPCYWAAAEWYSGPYGRNPALAKTYMDLFNARIGPFVAYYSERLGR